VKNPEFQILIYTLYIGCQLKVLKMGLQHRWFSPDKRLPEWGFGGVVYLCCG